MSGFLARVGSSLGTIAARATGIAALGIVGYDAHVIGKLEADTYYQSREASRLSSAAFNCGKLDYPSATMGKVKKKLFNFQLDNKFFKPFETTIGYFKGAGASWLNSFVPAIMGLFALFARNKVVSKLSALGLLIYGGIRVVHDGFGIGRVDKLKRPYR